MTPVSSLVAFVISTLVSAAPFTRPSDPDYSVTKAFAAVVSRDEEFDLLILSFAFDLHEIRDGNALTWHGPFMASASPIFSAFYDPPSSRWGISKVAITWDAAPLSHLGKPAVEQTLTLVLQPERCPSQQVLEKEIGSPMRTVTLQGPDAGRVYEQNFFSVPGWDGKERQVFYWPKLCEFTATHIKGG